MDTDGMEVLLQRVSLASGVLQGVMEMLEAARPDASLSPGGVAALLATAADELKTAKLELEVCAR